MKEWNKASSKTLILHYLSRIPYNTVYTGQEKQLCGPKFTCFLTTIVRCHNSCNHLGHFRKNRDFGKKNVRCD